MKPPPQNIHDVLRGPHVKATALDGDVTVVIAEPLRFIPITHVNGRDQIVDWEQIHG